ncbi:MAG TPA: hypothetical protein VFP84_39750 [Kofleriaceae bacterium]|nr:hypothetical protein [Kofleriaceae bacterium]
MRALDAELHDPKVFAMADDERGGADRVVRLPAAEIAHGVDDAEHDVHGVAGRERGAHEMRRASARPFGLASRTRSLARREQRKLPALAR